MIDSMGAVARRLVRTRFAAFVVCAGGFLLAVPASGLAASWSPTTETVTGSSNAVSIASGLDSSLNLTAVWDTSAGIETNVRSASTTTWGSSATTISADPGANSPDVAVADGVAVATWIGSDGNAYASVRSAGAWGPPSLPLSSAVSSSPQAAIINGLPTVFWISGNTIETATQTTLGGLWGSASSPIATPVGATISDLRVALNATGSGAASWISTTDNVAYSIEGAQITSSAWPAAGESLSTTATALSTTSVASDGSLSAIAWTEPTEGVQVAVAPSSASNFAIESLATSAGSDPAVAVDANGHVIASWVAGSAEQAEIRTGLNAWSTPATVSSDSPLELNLSSDASGDVASMWTTSAGAELRVYDATKPTVSINAPSSPASPGLHSWSVTTSDVWSSAGSSTAWTFSSGGAPTGTTVQDNEVVPGTVTANVLETDGAGNTNTATAAITISPVAPTNTAAPTINNGTSPVDGGTNLTVNAGSWSGGNPTPVITEQWQRCAASGSPCVNVAAQSDGSYKLTSADVGSRIRVEETATNTGGAPFIDSAQTRIVGPRAIAAPSLTVSALADEGQLTASSPASAWDGVDPSTLNLIYHFQHCNGTSCTDVQATGSNIYVMQAGDVGLQMQVSVVAEAGSAGVFSPTATSTFTQPGIVAPKSTAPPTLSGTPQDTQVLTANSPASSWDGVSLSLLDPTYQFTRCDANGANCTTSLQNTSSSTYTLKPTDIGSTIRVTSSASANGSDPTVSSPSAVSAVITPFDLGAPGTPTGTLQDGAALLASTGTWADQSSLSFQYQWIGCSAALGCVPLGAPSLSQTYNLQPTDVGTTIEVAVSAYSTAAPGVGLATITTGPTGPIAPLNTGPSSITEPPLVRDGQTFTASIGSWHGATNLTIGYQWQRCTSQGVSCQPIQGATNSSYLAKAGDVGSTLVVNVSASKNGSAITPSLASSSQTDVIAPASTGAPALTGAPQDTQLITAASPPSDWDNVSPLDQSYQFFRCDSAGANCGSSPIQSGQSTTYTLTATDIGSTIRVVALAAKNGSSTTPSASSPQTSIITPLLLGAAATPSGTTQDGSTLTASPGTWADQGQLNFNYQWFQCSSSCSSLGAPSSASTYALQPTDVGDTIEAVVTAFVGAGAASTTSAQTFAIAPLNTGTSVISAPTAQDGQLFTASDGAWDGATGLQFSYQWKRCDATGSSCAAISATTKTYTSVAADVGQTLKATVTASKGTSATTPSPDSAASAIVAPRNTIVPTIAGTPTDGQSLTTTASTAASWDNPPAPLTFSYQWLRCDATGNTCNPISGATSTSYTLTPDDVASATDPTHAREQVRVQVTAAVGGVSTASNSGASGVIAAIATQLIQQPQIFGGSYDNVQLSVQPGMYKGTGIVYTNYQWLRCDPPLVNPTCTNVGTAGAKVYAVTSADVGHYVTVAETVTNRLGVVTTSRAAFGGQPVLENPFSGDAQPVVSGSYIDGGTLTTTNGTWTPADPSTVYTYEWEACAQISAYPNCDAIQPPATSSSYTLTSSDVGTWVVSRVRATYTPSGGVPLLADDWSDINLATQVAAAPPVSSGVPAIAGNPMQGSTLTSSTGTWTGTNTTAVPITYTYQWLSCDSTGANCQPIAGATQKTYVPTGQDVGARLVVRVLAKNSGGAADAVSTPTAAVAGLPASSSGGGGATVNADPGTGDSAGAGGTVHAQGATGDKSLPRLTLVFLGGGTLSGGTTLRLDATCPKTEKSCKATFKLLAKLKKPTGKAIAKPVTVASIAATLGSGQKKLLKLKLSAAARAVLRSKRKLAVTLNVSIVDAAGNITPKQTKGITLRWKKG